MRKGGWITTYSGKKFWPLDPKAEDISIYDIAHALSLICRFGGHCRNFYSVAQHSILGAQHILLKEKSNALAAYEFLFHDASEAYLCDLSRPIKHDSLLGSLYKKAEKKLEQAIAERFNVSYPLSQICKDTDMSMLLTEARDLGLDTTGWIVAPQDRCFEDKIVPWSPVESEQGFLRMYDSLSATLFIQAVV